ncbi:MAG: hypothetical protein U0Z26_05290 [Anaerolineales bacterium]
MKLISKIFISLLVGVLLAFGFDFLFLGMAERPFVDQALLIFFSTAAFGYITFSILEEPFRVANLFSGLKRPSIDRATLIKYLPGILLALFFLAVYIPLGLKLNPPHIDTVDNFLDADNTSWMQRIASPSGSSLEMRGPHPFAYFVFRPLGWLFNIFTQNFAVSAVLLNAIAGGLCVFFAWVYIERKSQSKVYAFLIAAMLGLSTSHLFFSSVIETYIFSALSLVVFCLLLDTYGNSIGPLVVGGLGTFGITFTNFVQNFILFIVSRPKLKDVIRFVGLVISFGVLISIIHSVWYPSSKLFFLPSDAKAEGEFATSILHDPSWKSIGRVLLLFRTIFLYTMIAPRPFVFTTEIGSTFPSFNFFKIVPGTFSYSSYVGLSKVLVLVWMLLMLGAVVFFFIDLLRARKMDVKLGFVICLLFNFILHLYYGYEPFLYSPDWAYALVFFVATSLLPLSQNRLFQVALLVFLVGLGINQIVFMKFILSTVDPFLL